ncbi:MAG: choice-of-anchor Q domain-containing protein, partial [Isosphaeraceae bacterium]
MFSPQRLFGKRPGTIRKSRRARVRFLRPFIQQLEDRVMLSTLLVNNPTDAHVADETSLREAIAVANADAAAGTSDTITFDPSLGSSTINLTQGPLELSGAGAGTITIDGSSPSTPVTLNAGYGSRVFQIDSGVQAVITNVNIENGDVTNNNGGAIFNAGTLTVSNANVSDSYASYGGGIENQGALTLSNVTLTSNNASSSGGAIDSTGTLTVNESTLTGNAAADGGAISSEGMLTVNNSTFSSNGANNSGGAISSFSAPATITGGFFTGNNAAYGGVLENNAGTVTLTSDTLSNNTATTAGGAIENDSGPLTLNNTTIAGNIIYNGNGGGINNNGGTVTITNSTFSGNQLYSTGSGGAIENSGGTVTASNSTFFDNSAAALGGAIDNESGGKLSLTNATVSSNSADNSADKGGGIENNGGTLSLQNTIVAGNYDNSGPDIGGVITTDNGNNLLGTAVNNTTTIPTPGPNDVFSDTPMLGTLADYGGPTQTLALLAGSPAIGAGNASATNPATDQRGLPRVVNGSLDIGAFQTQPPTLAFTTLGQTADAGQTTGSITVELEDLDGNPAPAGSVGYSGNGTTADTTGGNNLTLVGGAGFAAGQTGQALSLNGANQYAITPNLASLFANSNASVTVSLWFKATGPGVIMDELGQTALNTGWHDSQIEILANGTVKVRVWNLSAVTLGTASFNAWHNVVLRYSAGTQTLDGFLDGVQSTSSTSGGRSTPYGSGYGLYYAFGATDTTNLGSGAYFNGLIQYISIFNRPLSNTEVQTLYGGGSGVAVTPSTVTLSSSSTGGSFSYPNGLPITGGQIVIPQGASSFTFDYTDTQPGTPMLTASATGFASATQQETVLPAPISVTPQPTIVVGRVLSYYDVPDVQNNQDQLTITYTVYNEATDPETGVLLTTTLQPGVTFLISSVSVDGTTTTQLPDQNGQNLAWSLGTIQGYDRASVTVTVSLANPIPLRLDSGAQAFATLDAGAVSASTPAATLSQSAIDPNLLASTPDANTTDPYIQEEAAQLDYNAQNIFNFLHTQIGYNSYTGSMRGARGTLWSDAGNALDVASLGVALMRASGIPAQYVSGTLSYEQAQTLILSMFPASYQTVGYIPSGTTTSDPADDSQLLSETESHYWFQFDTGSGMQNADPLMPGATIGQTFTTSTGEFTQVPQDLEATTEVQLVAEIYNEADGALGLQAIGISPLQDTTVLDQTFDDVYLVGRPLTIGNLVSTSSFGALFLTTTTNTYTPYIVVGDDALPDSQLPDAIIGQQYQEFLTNFPLASQVLTGLFLNITLSGPGTTSETFSRALVDRIGYAARQGMEPPENLSINPSGPPIITPFDVTTLNILPGLQSPGAAQLVEARASQELASVLSDTGATPVAQTDALIAFARAELAGFTVVSDQETANLESGFSVAAYSDVPRITTFSSQLVTANNLSTMSFSFDLVNDSLRAIGSPGQNVQAALGFASDRGVFDSMLESQMLPVSPGSQNSSAAAIIQEAMQQGIPLAVITASNISVLQGFDLPADALARITTNVESGLTVIVPTEALTVNGIQTTAWFNVNPTTGETIAESEDGGNQGIVEYDVSLEVDGSVNVVILTEDSVGEIGFTRFTFTPQQLQILKKATANENKAALLGVTAPWALFSFAIEEVLIFIDPPLPLETINWNLPFPTAPGASSSIEAAEQPNQTPGQVGGTVQASSVAASGNIAASWASGTTSGFLASSLGATAATVVDSQGMTVGSGMAALSTAAFTQVAISGNTQYSVNGQGSLSFYGPAESPLGVSGDWQNYTATVTGNVSITLTVRAGALTLNGQALPAGTYTITTNSATLSGSGTTSSPNFAGSASIMATGGTINLGPGSGSLSVGGTPLDPEDETTLDGYNGTISVSANGDGTDSVNLNGTAGNVLQVLVDPTTFTTNQNTLITFQPSIQTSLADTYNLTANAPPGWTVTIDSSGNVTATPAPGLQGGTYPIQIIAQSQTDPDLEAQTTVEVTITPTQPGINFNVVPDPIFTVPYNGAQLPTAFRAVIQNLGPAADTYNLTFSNIPSGFTLVESATSDTVPAGQMGIVGLYLEPNPGQPVPPQGTQLSFTVTATSTTDPSITQAQTETFTVPAIDAVSVPSTPTTLNTTPGAPVTDTITITNLGNVEEDNIQLTATLPSGLTISGLAPISSLAPGQSASETVTLTPDVSTPLNSTLNATITATFGPSAAPVTQTFVLPVNVVVPGATELASAADAAALIGNSGLSEQLNDLSIALTDLVQNPTSAVYLSQSLAAITSIVSQVTNDPFLASFAGGFTAASTALANATSPSDINAALTNLGPAVGSLATTLTDEGAHSFVLSLANEYAVVQPGATELFTIDMQNTGSANTTYDFSVSGLPAGVTATFSQPSITLATGQQIPFGSNVVTLGLSETGDTLFSASFTVTATAEGAPEISLGTPGQLTPRNETLQVVGVVTNPPFTNPGGQVDVTAQVECVVNEPRQVDVSYTVTDSNGNLLFTSTPVPVPLSITSTLTTVDLGTFDTTGFVQGLDTITVTVTDQSSQPLASATGQGSVFIGLPVTPSLSVSPSTL